MSTTYRQCSQAILDGRSLGRRALDRVSIPPVDGIVVAASPQELEEMIVEKAVKMARMMNILILNAPPAMKDMSFLEKAGRLLF